MSRKWKKVLYERQEVPDNHVDETFLSDLRKNVNLYHYSWREAFTGVLSVTHEIACTVLFALAFALMESEACSIPAIFAGVGALTLFSFAVHQWTCLPSQEWTLGDFDLAGNCKSCVVFLAFGLMFSPVLKDLTTSVSTDTIHAMATLMMVAHVLLQDYGARAAVVSSILSLNSAFFAAVCLSSRLPTAFHTFALMILAVEVFVLVPLMRKTLQENVRGMLVTTTSLISCVLVGLFHVSVTYALLFALLCVLSNVVFPALFVYSQKYKETIFGPWDEAVVK